VCWFCGLRRGEKVF